MKNVRHGKSLDDISYVPRERRSIRRRRWWSVLLLLPLIGLLYPPFYAHAQPTLGGLPFFIWYQFVWVVGGIATTVIVVKFGD